MSNPAEKKSVTGLDTAENRKEAEYDLLTALLEASDYKTDEENIVEVDVVKGDKKLFTVHLHPLSDRDVKLARKKATTYMPNPNGKKLPPIEKAFDEVAFKNWVIYLATVEEDQQKIWGNPGFMQKKGLSLPVDSIDELLPAGKKAAMFDAVAEISGLGDDDDGEESGEEAMDEAEFAKN